MLRSMLRICCASLALVTVPVQAASPASTATAEAPPPIRHIFGLRTPLRDGVELSSDVWLPATPGPHPVILIRTPYVKALGSFAADAIFFARNGYAVVVQDVRGRGDSAGEFDFFFQEADDGHDSVEAIAAQPWSNGKVCMIGESYMATVQWQAARRKPPHLACMVSVSPGARFLDELPSLGGAHGMQWSLFWLNAVSDKSLQMRNAAAVDWPSVFAHRPLRTADEAMGRKMRLYREFMEHDTLDAYWKRLYLTPQEYAGIDIPLLAITGLFDTDQTGALFTWTQVEAHSPAARDRRFLVIGPWTHDMSLHGGSKPVGDMQFPDSAATDNRDMALRFFHHYLRGDGPAFGQPRVRVYMTGADEWRSFDRFPLAPSMAKPTAFHLSSKGAAVTAAGDGTLSRTAPGRKGVDRYVFDPRNPVVEAVASSASDIGQGRDRTAIQARPDVLVYTGAPLERPVEIVGPVSVELTIASDARDTDFTASLTDVGPDGKAISLGPLPFGILRARYRHGLERTELLTPGKPEKIRVELGQFAHRFRSGHRIRLEISSSAYPVVNPNQNTGAKVADDVEWKLARNSVLHGPGQVSQLILPVLGESR